MSIYVSTGLSTIFYSEILPRTLRLHTLFTGKEDTVLGGWHVGRSCLTHSFVWRREEAPHFVARDTIILIDQSLTFTF